MIHFWVNIMGLFNPTHINRVNKLMINNLLLNSQNKSDLDETYEEPSDGHCLNPDQTKPQQTNSISSLKQQKQVES